MTWTQLRSAVRKLGPERSEQALRAFTDPVHFYHSCVLAHAYGPVGRENMWMRGNLGYDMHNVYAAPPPRRYDCHEAAGALLGLTPIEAAAVSNAHCGWSGWWMAPVNLLIGGDALMLWWLLKREARKTRPHRKTPSAVACASAPQRASTPTEELAEIVA